MTTRIILMAAALVALLGFATPALHAAPPRYQGAAPTSAYDTLMVNVIATTYKRDVAEVTALHAQGINYQTLYQLLGLVQAGSLRIEEVRAMQPGSAGWQAARRLGWREWQKVGHLHEAVARYCGASPTATGCREWTASQNTSRSGSGGNWNQQQQCWQQTYGNWNGRWQDAQTGWQRCVPGNGAQR